MKMRNCGVAQCCSSSACAVIGRYSAISEAVRRASTNKRPPHWAAAPYTFAQKKLTRRCCVPSSISSKRNLPKFKQFDLMRPSFSIDRWGIKCH